MPRIVDGFLFYNEVELLTYRLEILWDVVDYFVIAESPLTFTGKPKPMFFDPAKYEKYASKIVHVIVDDMPVNASSPWVREAFQRNAIIRGVRKLELRDDDLLLLSDADEIPNPAVLRRLRTTGISAISNLKQLFYAYNFNTRYVDAWYSPKVIPYEKLTTSNRTLEHIRQIRAPHTIDNGGWHCSWFGTPEFIRNKIQSYSHQEYNTRAYTDLGMISERILCGSDPFNRGAFPMIRVHHDPSLTEFPPGSDWLLSLFTPPIQ